MGHGEGVSFIEVCVFFEALTTILTLIHIVWYRYDREGINDNSIWIAYVNTIITCLVFTAIIVMAIWH